MIFDILASLPFALAQLVLQILPPAATGPQPPVDAAGFAQVLGTAMLFDTGFPVHEGIAALGAYVAIALVVDAYIALRALMRWLPSWVTGGG